MVTIVNYGLGNIQAFVNIYRRLNIDVCIADNAGQLHGARKIVLPGVGAFDWAMTRLNASGMRDKLDQLVLVDRVPVIGICVGMQIMAKRSDEGTMEGLGWIDAEVKKFDVSGFEQRTHLPHMGWNTITPFRDSSLFAGMEMPPRFYFLHSYYFLPHSRDVILAETEYGIRYCSAVQYETMYGVQFHPEKSHQWGVQLLKNFAEM